MIIQDCYPCGYILDHLPSMAQHDLFLYLQKNVTLFKTFQVERLLSTEQKTTDFRSPDDGIGPDHRPTTACTRLIIIS